MKTCKVCSKQVESICQKCESRIHRQLDDLFDLWHEAHSQLLPGRTGNGGKSSVMSIGVNVLALSFVAGNDILGLLHEWEKLIRQERNLTRPAFLKIAPNMREEISEAIKFHQINLSWSMDQDWIEDFAKELKNLHSEGIKAAKRFVKKNKIIKCPTELEDGICNNSLKINESDPLEILECRKCQATWTTLRLMMVALSDPNREVWLDAEALSNWMGVSERHIRRVAKEYQVAKRGKLFNVKQLLVARNVAI